MQRSNHNVEFFFFGLLLKIKSCLKVFENFSLDLGE